MVADHNTISTHEHGLSDPRNVKPRTGTRLYSTEGYALLGSVRNKRLKMALYFFHAVEKAESAYNWASFLLMVHSLSLFN